MKYLVLILLICSSSLFALEYKEDNFDFNADISLSAESYFQTNSDIKQWEYDFNKRKPMVNIGLNFVFYDFIEATADLPIMKDRLVAENDSNNYTNIITNISDLDMNFPYRAFITVGIENLNLSIGRDLLEIGEGLLLSPNTFYHDYLRATTTWNSFGYKYYFISLNETDIVSREIIPKYLIAHNIGYNFFGKVEINLVESIMVQGMDFDLKVLNPFLILHDEYLAYSDMANAFTTLNVSITPIDRLEIFAELAMDQYATPYENETWDQEEPNAMGWVIGVGGQIPVRDLELDLLGSFSYTDPYLGLDSSGIHFTTTKNYVTHSQGDLDEANGIAVTDFLGIGPDSQILTLQCNVMGLNNIDLGIKYNFKRIGEVNANTVLTTFDQEAIDKKTPSGDFDTYNIITLSGGYDFTNYLNLSSDITYINKDNTSGFQFVLSLTFLY